MFGANRSIIGGDHKYDDPQINMRFNKELGDNRTIIVEEDAWIGHGCILLKKAHIGEGSIVGAYSLVNKKLLLYCVYAGNPAKFIKTRFKCFEDLNNYLEMMKNKYNFQSRYSQKFLETLYE